MTAAGRGAAKRAQAGEAGATVAYDRHLARCAPLCEALGGLDWSRPIAWFHDFGLLPLDGGLRLRLGVTPPSGSTGRIKALTASLMAPAAGLIATQEFPLSPYVNRERDAASAIILCEQGGRYRFVRGAAGMPLAAAERQRLQGLCRAIEAWAALLSGGGLPGAWSACAPLPAAPAEEPADDPLLGGDQEQLVVEDEARESSSAP